MQLSQLVDRLRVLHPADLIIAFAGGVDGATETLGLVRSALPELRQAKGAILMLGLASNALAQLSRSLAAELGPVGIRANAMAFSEESDGETAMHAAAFLLSIEASYVTGVMLPIGSLPDVSR